MANAGDGTVSLIQLNDLHAHLAPHPDLIADPASPTGTHVGERGGLARTATLIKRLRAQNPANVLVNVGDTFHGGVEAMYTLGNAVVDPINALGVDVGVPGNWDFAYGPSVTRRRYTNDTRFSLPGYDPGIEIKKPNFPNLAANVKYTRSGPTSSREFLPPTLMLTRGGVKVGFIGLSSDIVPYMDAMLSYGLTFTQGESAHRDLINQYAANLRAQGANVVVVLSELGIHKDYRLAQIIKPGAVDVFLSAHTHEATFTPLTSASGALVVESGNDGYLGHMRITVKNGKVTTHAWELLAITPDMSEDAQVASLVRQERAPFLAGDVNMTIPLPYIQQQLTMPIDTILTTSSVPLDRRHALESRFNNAFTDLLRDRTGKRIAMSPGFRFDSVIGAAGSLLEDNTVATGAVTVEDAYRFFPVSYSLATAEVGGARLRQIVEDSLVHTYSTEVFQAGRRLGAGYCRH
ncbi:MAG: metallophosphoesterase [Desulfomicrobium escambiense]|nr:metallophosphoesterase [Desulfomicrobium escambiense]